MALKRLAEVPLWHREFLRADELAALLGIGRTTVFTLRDGGIIPAPVEVNAMVMWRTREVRDWIDAGCPMQSRWQWQPARLPKLDQLIAERHVELDALRADIQREAEQLARLKGEVHIEQENAELQAQVAELEAGHS